MIKIGEYNTLSIMRETDPGLFLEDKDGNEVSETWLNSGGDFTDHDGVLLATIMYNNHVLLLGTDGAIYLNADDEYPICFSDELPEYQFD